MASGIDRLAQQIAGLLKKDSPDGYDTTATVTRVEGGTAWVHIPGGVDETPVRMTVNARVGDTVQVRVSGGRAFLVGNGTAPPTDDHTANQAVNLAGIANKAVGVVSKIAEKALKIAGDTAQYFWFTETGTDTGAHITEIPQDEFFNDPTNGGPNLLARSNGVAIRNGLIELAVFSASGIQIGTDTATRFRVDLTNGLKLGDKIALDTSGNASFTGKIESTSGHIGGWNLSAASLSGTNSAGTKGTGFQVPSSGTWAIAVGYDTSQSGWASAPFRVNHNGQVFLGDKLTLKGASRTYAAIDFIITSNNTDVSYGGLSITNSDALSLRGTQGTTVSDPSSVDIHTGGNTYYSYIDMGGDSSTDGVIMLQCRTRNASTLYGLVIDSSGTYKNSFSGNLKVDTSIFAGSAFGTGGKTAWNDTAHDGTWLSSTGEIHLTEQSASRGGTISFHFNRSASATTSLYEGTSGVLTNTGRLVTSDWSGTGRTPVSSATTDGGRISYLQATAASLRVAGQWGTAGGSYTITDFLPPTSDVRLKKNVEDCEVEDALSVINRIRMRSFDWLHTDEHQRIGFIADELEQIDPKLSVGGGTERDGTIHYKTVDTFYMMGYLVKAVQELSTEVERLRRELNGNHSES